MLEILLVALFYIAVSLIIITATLKFAEWSDKVDLFGIKEKAEKKINRERM